MNSIVVKAKTMEAAIEDGLEKLQVKQEDVEVEIISQGGMFKKAEVKLTLKEGVKPAKETKEEIKQEKKPEPKPKPKAEVKPAQKFEPKPVPATTGEGSAKLDICVEFVRELLNQLGTQVTITTQSDDNTHMIQIHGEDVGRLIGKGGEALFALQTLVSSIAISNQNGDIRRIFINVEGYREKREETLKALAQRKAEYVKKSGRFVKLEPMTPRDRAIMHNVVSEIEGVRSYSTGQGQQRCLVIAPGEQREPRAEKKKEEGEAK